MRVGRILLVSATLSLAVLVYQMRRPSEVSLTKEAAAKSPAVSGRHEGESMPPQKLASAHGRVGGNETSTAPEVVSVKMPPADPAQQQTRKSMKHVRYDPLLRLLGLTPTESDRFIELMMEQEDTRTDLQTAVRDQNLPGNSPEVENLWGELNAPIVQSLRDLLGSAGYDAYTSYEKGSFYRQVYVSPMVPDFAAAGAPLSDLQFTQLTDIIAANDRPYQRAPTDLGKESSIDWETVLSQSSAFLTPAQLAVIRTRAPHFLR